jgi:V/A-type H+/Na+-transporting ATPase subunit F
MQFLCIGDEETARGFRLAGITAIAVTTAEQARAVLEDVAATPDCGVLIISERTAAMIRPEVEAIRLERDHPLIVEIPGPEGPLAGRKTLREFVQEAVGMRIG